MFNVEFKLTATGPKIIDINSRLGGFYIHQWTREIFGVDFLQMQTLAAMGTRPIVPSRPPSNQQMVGLCLYPSQHKVLKQPGFLEKLQDLHKRGVVHCVV